MIASEPQWGRYAAIRAPIELPATSLFDAAGVYMDSAYFHPLSRGAEAAVQGYLNHKVAGGLGSGLDVEAMQESVRADFARLVGATADEISFAPSTTAAENLIVDACGLTTRGRIVTDRLHYFGSLHLYESLKSRGVDVTVIEPRAGRIRGKDLAHALANGADLVALSAVSSTNGFAPDLAEVCTLAHRSGARVYVDAIQAVGAAPIDLGAIGVDFCGCGAYKWLMGDMGLAFLYVRADRRDELRRTQFGARQLHPRTRAGLQDAELKAWAPKSSGSSFFEVGTIANACVAALSFSLPWLLNIGAARIASHRQVLMEQIEEGLRRFGLTPELPPTLASPIVAYKHPRTEVLSKALKAANMYATVYRDRVRLSPSVFNTPGDVTAMVQLVGDSL